MKPNCCKRAVFFFLICAASFLLQNCAKQVRPSGGPVDKTPPQVIHVTPENNATLVPLTQKIEIEFNERMDQKSLRKAVFITPDPGLNVKYKWKGGRKLRITMGDSLLKDVTYVITLGSDLRDLHGNALSQSYTLAFSTGEKLSHGKISGQAYAEKKNKGVIIWAYLLEGEKDPNPEEINGNYTTQTDDLGKYQLTNLSEGHYRIFAVEDVDHNRFFEKGVDGIGIADRDVTLTDKQATIEHIDFRLKKQDTVGPALISAAAKNQTQILLRFDEPLDKESIKLSANYKIFRHKSSSDSLHVQMAVVDEKTSQDVLLITQPQKGKVKYDIEVNNITDASGNLVDKNYRTAQIRGRTQPDTLKPKIVSVTPPDSSKGALLNTGIEVIFDEPVQQPLFEQTFRLSDTSDVSLPGMFSWPSPLHVVFDPENSLQYMLTYRISANLDSVLDLSGNPLAPDSTLTLSFTAVNPDTFSSISGTLSDNDSTDTTKIILIARQNKTDGPTYRLEMDKPGPYEFKQMLPGVYVIGGFRDRDQNGEYSFGQAIPFQPAERFFVYPDSVKVRARWPNEGNDLTFY